MWWLLCVAAACSQPPAAGESGAADMQGKVPRMRVEGALDMGGLALLQRGLRAARDSGTNKLILEIDTPGGSLELMWQYSKALAKAFDEGQTVIAWVNRNALSAGALVALSCDRIHMLPEAVIGAAQPVMSTPFGIAPLPEQGGVREKISSSMRAEFRAMAERRGRSGALAEAMVDPAVEVRRIHEDGVARLITGVEWDNMTLAGKRPEFEVLCPRGQLLTLTGSEALELGICDGLASEVERVLEDNGLYGRELLDLERRPSEILLGRLNDFAFLLLAAGLLLAYLELKVPGFGVPGILSAVCFGLLLVGRHMVGLADVPHIVFATLGMALIAVELFFVPGTIWVGLLGGLLLGAALVFSSLGPRFSFDSPLDRELLLAAVSNFIVTALSSLVLMWVFARFLPETPMLRRMALGRGGSLPGEPVTDSFGEAGPAPPALATGVLRVGARGRAKSDLRPVGMVVLDAGQGTPVEARSSGAALARGTRVRVVEVHGARLVVEAEEELA